MQPPRSRLGLSSRPLLLLTIVALSGAAAAAITWTYTNTSTVTTSVAPVPVQFLAGDDAGPAALSTYVSSYSISTNRTFISTSVKGIPEANLTVGSFFKLTNADTTARTVTLSTGQVTNAFVTAYTIQVYDSSNALQGTLDLTSASPTAQFAMPAGSTHYAKLTLGLASGAGANNVALTNSLTLSVA